VEETVRGIVRASARRWVARGTSNLEPYGLTNPHRIILLRKNGERISLDFGGTASALAQYAAVQAGGETYVIEFPWSVYRDAATYLSIP
jgi:hypothetical protein